VISVQKFPFSLMIIQMLRNKHGVVFFIGYVCLFVIVAYNTGRYSKENFFANFKDGWDQHTDLIIVSAHYNENLEWLKQSECPIVICSKETSKGHAIAPNKKCSLPNRGREAASYIKFILAFYDDLPRRIAFIHGHQIAWHQSIDLLSAIRCANKTKRFISLNNTFRDDRNMNNPVFKELNKNWGTHFYPILKKELPKRLFHDCCAQFIVTKEAIRSIQRQSWKYWLDLLLTVEDDWILAVQFEFIWHYIFGEEAVLPTNKNDYIKDNFFCTPEPAISVPPGPPVDESPPPP
jgi:hypothetical protein